MIANAILAEYRQLILAIEQSQLAVIDKVAAITADSIAAGGSKLNSVCSSLIWSLLIMKARTTGSGYWVTVFLTDIRSNYQ